jgi:hypothetical protein
MNILVCFTLPNNLNLKDTPAWESYQAIGEHDNIKHVLVQGASICINRNRCIIGYKPELIHQKEFSADRFLFVDYDITFTLEDIKRLAEANKPIIGGKYVNATNDVCAGYWSHSEGLAGAHIDPELKSINKVDWLGAGFLMVAKEALEAVEYPWFRPYIITHGPLRSIISEDLGFCKYMADHNIYSYLHCDVEVDHVNPTISRVPEGEDSISRN